MSDRESKACPLCKSRAERIVGLKAEAARWRDRYADAMAKLARVKEAWCNIGLPQNDDTELLDAILSGTPEPLAVVDGIKVIDGETSHRRACVDAWLPGKAEAWTDEVYTLVVLPKEATNGD